MNITLAEHVERMGEIRNKYVIVVEYTDFESFV
jgi:hypothetical protein